MSIPFPDRHEMRRRARLVREDEKELQRYERVMAERRQQTRQVTLAEARELYYAGRITSEQIDKIEAEARRRFEQQCVEVVIPGGDAAWGSGASQ